MSASPPSQEAALIQPDDIAAAAQRVEITENLWITMSDGCRLAARLWLPEGAETRPLPTVFEFLPYRKRDVTRARDDEIHGYFAARGYACLRVDMRGSGDSQGHIAPMYDRQERDDGVEILRWIAAQPWSDGKVGMIGLSWGGSISLYCASEAPPELGAIVCVAGPHDSYGRDILFKGGCLINEVIGWAATMDALTARPPDPEIAGEGWRALWLDRLEHLQPELKAYLDHQRRDAFWAERNLTDRLPRMTVPALIAGGWVDSTVGTTGPELLSALRGPRKALIGPWSHKYPQHGLPGPAIDFLSEAGDWFDEHLRGIAPAKQDPALRAWMLRDIPAAPWYAEAPGHWVAEPQWPSPAITTRRLHLNPEGLGDHAIPGAGLPVSTDQTVGLCGGELMPNFAAGPGDDLPGDQAPDDAASLCFTSAPLADDMEILGVPQITLRLTSDTPTAMVAVRLNDVSPDGRSRRVSYAVLNLSHRTSDADPEPLVPGMAETITLPLHDIAYSFCKGHRVRVAISTTYWPLCWPQPDLACLTIAPGFSHLDLPQRPPRDTDAELRPFAPPPHDLMPGRTVVVEPQRQRRVSTDPKTGLTTLTIRDDGGTVRVEATGTEMTTKCTEIQRIHPLDPLSAYMKVDWEWRFARGDWDCVTRNSSEIRCDAGQFHVHNTLSAFENGRAVFSREYRMSFPRDHM